MMCNKKRCGVVKKYYKKKQDNIIIILIKKDKEPEAEDSWQW